MLQKVESCVSFRVIGCYKTGKVKLNGLKTLWCDLYLVKRTDQTQMTPVLFLMDVMLFHLQSAKCLLHLRLQALGEIQYHYRLISWMDWNGDDGGRKGQRDVLLYLILTS